MHGSRVGPRRAVRAVFFDFGGTLVAPLRDLVPLFRTAARRTGLRVDWDRLRTEIDGAWEDLWPEAPSCLGELPSFADRVHERALRRARAEGPIDEVVRMSREEALAPRRHRPYPETERVLRTLRDRGYALHVLSDHTDYLPLIVERLGWSEIFERVTFSQELGVQKPDLRLFALAVSRSRAAPSEVLHVGDRWDADYQGARQAGL